MLMKSIFSDAAMRYFSEFTPIIHDVILQVVAITINYTETTKNGRSELERSICSILGVVI